MRRENGLRVPETIDEFWCWLNSWGDSHAYENEDGEFHDGYRQALRDAYDHFDRIYPFKVKRHPTWMAWTSPAMVNPE